MANFTEGDVVFLKSGGPLMTVIEVRDDGKINCQWFDEKKVIAGAFIAQALEKNHE